ncbi:MAG: helix-turn-helix domain-containing protein [Faecalibacterium sp.]
MNERIKTIINELGLKRVDFAARLRISQPFVSELCSGAKAPSDRTISDICREFGVNELWLRTGEGEMFKAKSPASDKIMDFVSSIARNDDAEFRKRFVAMLADLDPADWELLERMAIKLTKKEEAPEKAPSEME